MQDIAAKQQIYSAKLPWLNKGFKMEDMQLLLLYSVSLSPPGVSKAILNAAGPAVADECRNLGKNLT